jgi:hypothetical protein
MKDMRNRTTNNLAKLLLGAAGLFMVPGTIKAQNTAFDYLNQTNISALFSADGQLFWDGKKANFEAPKGSGKNTLSTASLWIGGFDHLGQLHEAAQTYRESGIDFRPGPLDTVTGKIDSMSAAFYNKVWKVTKLEIDSFRAGLATPKSVMNWPGNGTKGFAKKLAPFVDLNGNGIYEPLKGEYPDITGDVMLWWVYNDATDYHNKTLALPMGIEIQASAYTYNCPDDAILSNTIFVKYKVFNRSANTYSKVFAGQFADLDIGNIFDDYIGCDSSANSFYGYNSTDFDKDTTITGKGFTYKYLGYGKVLPAQSVTFLKGIKDDNGREMPMSKFIFYNNEDNTPQGNPKTSADFYNLMSGHWLNGTALTTGGTGYGGTASTNFAFPGKPGDHRTWNELATRNTAGDRRGLGTFGPFTFNPGQSKEFVVAFGFHQSGGTTLQSLQLMRDEVAQLNQSYKKGALVACSGISTCVNPDSCLWPGDANNDGKGYMNDLFRIGYAFGAKGPARKLASADWVPQNASSWGQSFPDGVNFKYADCNGDGKIDSMDVVPISLNYAKTHSKSGGTSPATAGDPTLHIVFDHDTVAGGGTLSGKIFFSDTLHPINDVYGAAVSLVFDPTLFDPNSVQFDLGSSDMGTLYELLALYKANAAKGHTDISVVRNTKTGKKAQKIFIDFKLVVEDDLAGYVPAQMGIENAEVVDSKLRPISVNTLGAKVVISKTLGIKYKDLSAYINLYPNPAKNEIIVDLSKYTEATIQIKDMQGKELKTLKTSANQNITNIDIADLPEGMYIMDINTHSGHAIKKFSKIN